jgi:NADPH2:quinone reductase
VTEQVDFKTMKAVHIREWGGPEVLEIITLPRPEATGTMVLVAVEAAGVNRGDIGQRHGRYPPPPGAPDTLGLEFAGKVVATGPDNIRWKVGDEVCGLVGGGGYAEFCLVHEDHLLPIPRGLSMVEAAGLVETAATVWTNVFDDAALKSRERILIHGGASGIGTMAIQMAVAFGAEVYTTARGADRCRRCEAIGAKVAIDYEREDFVAVVKEKTGGRGVDVILDMVGGDYVERNIDAAAVRGRIVWIAFLKGSRVTVDLRPVQIKRLTLGATTLRGRSVAEKTVVLQALEREVWPFVERGQIKPVIDTTFPLHDVAGAHMRLETGSHFGKVVLEVTR